MPVKARLGVFGDLGAGESCTGKISPRLRDVTLANEQPSQSLGEPLEPREPRWHWGRGLTATGEQSRSNYKTAFFQAGAAFPGQQKASFRPQSFLGPLQCTGDYQPAITKGQSSRRGNQNLLLLHQGPAAGSRPLLNSAAG